jgi:uncharacterized protein YjbJ (UPF0337 family)
MSDTFEAETDEVEGHKKGLPKVDGDDSDGIEGHRMGLGKIDADESDEVEGHRFQNR